MSSPNDPRFPETRWSRILNAKDPNSPEVYASFTGLCEAYRGPIYHYFRRPGRAHDEAERLTHDFLAFAFQQRVLRRADSSRGRRFRAFLKTCLLNFARDDHRAQTAAQREGSQRMEEFDGAAADARFSLERNGGRNDDQLTPEQAFDRQFAREVLNRAITELTDECARDGKGPIFEAVRDFVTRDEKPQGYEAIAARLGLNSVGTLKSHVSRFRERYEDLIREQVRETVPRERDVDSELTELGNAL